MRRFAGPNGSGKSTLKSHRPGNLLGLCMNPAEITDGSRLELKSRVIPAWFRRTVLENFHPPVP